MCKRYSTTQSFLVPARVVFHHNPLEGHHYHEASEKLEKKEGIPIDVETKEVLKRQYLSHAGFTEDPRKKDRSRYLPIKGGVRAGYLMLKTQDQRDAYMKRYDRYDPELGYNPVEASYQASLRSYEKASNFSKVPKVQVSVRRPELAVDTKFFALGGRLAGDMAKAFPGGAEHMAGSDTPAKALEIFQSQIEGKDVKGATMLIAFDSELFRDKSSIDAHCKATRALLEAVKAAGMVAVMSTPLKDAKAKERSTYNNFIAKCYQDGLLGSLVGLGWALTARDTRNTKADFLKDPSDQTKGLNEEGINSSVNGFIAGVNIAHGHRSLDEKMLPVERTSADPILYYYGPGKKIEGIPPTTELVPGFPSVADVTDVELKNSLTLIGHLHVALDMGAVSYSPQKVEEVIQRVGADIQRVKESGQDVRFAEFEFRRQVASIYFMYAWKALQKAKKSPSDGNVKATRDAIALAKRKDVEFGFTNIFRARLEKVEEALAMLQ